MYKCEFSVDCKKGAGFMQTEWLTAVISLYGLCAEWKAARARWFCVLFAGRLNVLFCVPYGTDDYFKKPLICWPVGVYQKAAAAAAMSLQTTNAAQALLHLLLPFPPRALALCLGTQALPFPREPPHKAAHARAAEWCFHSFVLRLFQLQPTKKEKQPFNDSAD